MFGVTPLMPAYGRDYKSRQEAQDAFNAGYDFTCASGRYATKEDLASAGLKGKVECRSANKRKVWMLEMGS